MRYYFCIFLGLVLVNFGLVALYYAMVSVTYSETMGTVNGYVEQTKAPLPRVIIEFTADDGDDVEFIDTVLNLDHYKVGQHIAIFYNPSNPHDAHIRIYSNRLGLWIAPLFLFSMGLLVIQWGKRRYSFPASTRAGLRRNAQ
jgi:hypothetical protein